MEPTDYRRTRRARHASPVFATRATSGSPARAEFHDGFPRRVPGPQVLGRGRSDRRGRLWSVDGKVAAPTPDRLSAIFSLVRCRRHRVENALHWYDRIACREQQDRGGNRARRRGHRADAAWYLESRLTVRGDWIGHEPDPVSASAEAETFGAQS